MASREKLLAKARTSPSGWRKGDLDRLYIAWGFVITEGAKHTKCKHPVHRDLKTVFTRSSGEVSRLYVQDAVALIDELVARGGAQ